MTKFCFSIALLIFSSLGFAEQQTWYFVRHFEKQQGDNPSLTEAGKARSQTLAGYFADKPLTQVYSTNYNRTTETATPVAVLKNLPLQSYDPENLAEFSKKIVNLNHVLIVGHSNTTPKLIALLGGPVFTIDESEYGVLYTITRTNNEIKTTQKTISIK